MNKVIMPLVCLVASFAASAAPENSTYPAGNVEQAKNVAPEKNVAQAEKGTDMADPLSVYTGGDIKFGDQGMGASYQFGAVKGNWGAMGKIEGKNNFDTYRARIFTPNYTTGTGLYIDTGRDSSSPDMDANYATIGVLQAIPINKKLKLFVGLTYGQEWESEEKFEDTNILMLTTYAKYDLNDKFFFMLAPQYTYGLNGKEDRDFYMEMNAGYRIDNNNVLIFTGTTDNQFWMTYKFRL
jgi:hypothetical protein